MNLAGWVEKWGRAAPDHPAIALGGATYATYRQWAARSRALAGNLRKLCRPEDRVAIAMTNRPEFLEALFAIWHAGLVAVPMNAKLHGDEFGYIIGNTDATLALASPDRASDVAAHGRTIATGSAEWRRLLAGDGIDVAPRRPGDLAWLFYTSGTTGRPKGAMLTHGIMMAQTLAYFAEIEPVRPGDCVLHAAPMSHGSGCYGLPFVAMGAKTVIPESTGFDPDEIAVLLTAHGNVSFFAAPTMVSRLINHPGFAAADHGGLRTIIYGGAPMHYETLLRGLDSRSEIRANLRSGRSADDHHRAVEGHPRRSVAAALARGHGLGRIAAHQCRGARRRRGRSPVPPPAKSARCWCAAMW